LAKAPRAIVTGASSGIGRAFAERLAADGHDLVLIARRRDRLEELASGLRSRGSNVEIMAVDLTDTQALGAVEARVAGDDRVALLVNNAGFGGYGPFVELDPDLADRQIDLHLKALIRLTRGALPGMIERKAGAVISVASTLSFTATMPLARPKRAVYAATKAFITTFTQILAQELEGTGVKVQALCPGLVRTEFHDTLGGRPPGAHVLEPTDIVTASLAGLALGEVVCVPQLPDRAVLDLLSEAQRSVWRESLQPTIAPRYRDSV
jgi:short-subunit dehydrogenase